MRHIDTEREYFAFPVVPGSLPNQASVEIFARDVVKGNVAAQAKKLAAVRAVVHDNGILQVIVDRSSEVGTVDTLFTLEDDLVG